MSERDGFRQMHHRIDDLEKRLAATAAEIGKAGEVPAHFQADIDAMYAKAKALRQKLEQPGDTGWEAVKDEAEADWDILSHSFERWVRHIDALFRGR
jgi:uncharacterized coiled-coil protein SlyX